MAAQPSRLETLGCVVNDAALGSPSLKVGKNMVTRCGLECSGCLL